MDIVYHNGSNYDYHFIIKKLPEQFEKQITCLGKNTEKYINFSVPIEKEVTRIDKNREEITKNISYRLEFIDRAIFMASSLSSFANNFHKIKCKDNFVTVFFEYTNLKDDLIEHKCICCNKDYQQKFDEKLKERFF